MSTLRVDTIQNAAGTDSPINVPGTAKAWVNFNGTGTVAIRASYNVSSITDNGTGDYTVNFTSALADANYSMTVSSACNGNLTNTGQNLVASIRDQVTLSCRVFTASCWNTSAAGSAGHDTTNISVAIFR